ncbi:THUMP domain-containing class I SAM-dependent RNA methyltransferase [Petrachloros mirabilis]
MDSTKHGFFSPCPRGLEAVFEEELHALGVAATRTTEGGVGFHAPWSSMYWVNLQSRIASRVLWVVGQSRYTTEEDVYRAAYALPWPDWFTTSHTIKVKISARRCPLPSLDFLTLRIKDAVCDKFMAIHRKRPTVDTHRPHIRLDAFLDQDTVTFYLDTSGEPLFKRGYRIASVEAPMRENLAAGLLRLTGWTPDEVFFDPMCGSGTIALEAALMARRMAPGLSRSFAFERLRMHDASLWGRMREAARAKQLSAPPAPIYASDQDAAAVKIAQRTFQGAGVAIDIRLRHSDMFDLTAPAEKGVLVINPPYGVRLDRAEHLESFYPRLGDWLKQNFAGWRAYVFTGDARLPKMIGLAPSRRTPLFNGGIECRFYEFKIVQGPMRKHQSPSGKNV